MPTLSSLTKQVHTPSRWNSGPNTILHRLCNINNHAHLVLIIRKKHKIKIVYRKYIKNNPNPKQNSGLYSIKNL